MSELIDKLDKMSQTLNGIGGRLIIASLRDKTVKEAHDMVTKLGCDVDDLINEIMERAGDPHDILL